MIMPLSGTNWGNKNGQKCPKGISRRGLWEGSGGHVGSTEGGEYTTSWTLCVHDVIIMGHERREVGWKLSNNG